MNTLHERLLEERKRLGFTQDQIAEIGGIKRRAQIHYESGERCPDGHYLAAIAEAGADVQYILTGRRANDMKSRKTAKMVELMEALDDNQQDAVLCAVEEKKRLNELEDLLRKTG